MRRVLFEKRGKAAWMSHLDLMRLMQRAFRRAGVLLHHSQGFTPHAYVSMPLPLSVGTESVCEIMEYELDTEMEVSAQALNRVLPEGLRVLEVYQSDRKTRELSHLAVDIFLEYDGPVPEEAPQQLRELFARPSLTVEKRSKRGPEETDILPMIAGMEISPREGGILLQAVICAQNPSLNPSLIVAAIGRYLPRLQPDGVRICRREVLDARMAVFR